MPPVGSGMFAPAIKGAACAGSRPFSGSCHRDKATKSGDWNFLPSQILGKKTEYHWLMDTKFNLKDNHHFMHIQPAIRWHSSWLTNFIKVGYLGRERRYSYNSNCKKISRELPVFNVFYEDTSFSTCLRKHSYIFPILASENTQVPYHLSPRCVGSFLKESLWSDLPSPCRHSLP